MQASITILHVTVATQDTVSFQLFHLLRVDDEAKLKALQEVSDSFDVSIGAIEGYSKCAGFEVSVGRCFPSLSVQTILSSAHYVPFLETAFPKFLQFLKEG